MTPAEIAALLTAAKALDDRVTPDRARAAAWSAVLDGDLDFDGARQALVDHYATETRAIMPADINLRWRAEKKRRADAAAQERLQRSLEAPGVPMPPEIRAQIQRIVRRSSAITGRQ